MNGKTRQSISEQATSKNRTVKPRALKGKGLSHALLSVLLAALLACLAVSGCSSGAASDQPTTSTGQQPSPGQQSQLGVEYATGFKIQYMDNGVKLVTDTEGRELLLVPKEAAVPAGYEDKTLVRTPISRVFFGSTPQIGLLGSLGVDSIYDSIVGVATEENEWTTPQVIERFKSGQIKYVKTDNWGTADAETMLGMNLDMVFTTYSPERGKLSQYDAVGLPYVSEGDWLEKSSEAYLEWVKFFAAFYNLDDLADQVFEAKIAAMKDLAAKVANVPDAERPVLAYAMLYDGTVYTQSSDSTTAKELSKAGAKYYLTDLASEGNLNIGREEFFNRARNADILVYSGLLMYTPNKAALLKEDPLFADLKAFKNGQVYIFASDYYMRSADKDVLFQDMVAIAHPDIAGNHKLSLIIKLPD
ncbi:MAG: ABC transporter substrate-binding protein [Actinomycetia bacterium]|nr:ABC transporter substrate-binding protein [Actinomycetes bacterium]